MNNSDFMSELEEQLKKNGLELNEQQKNVVVSDKNTVVSAGAGSGKTTVLSYRFLRLVMEGKAKINEILTLTFTRKAAAEMHSRIFHELLSHKDEKIIADQISLLSDMAVSTLDSFCVEIVRADCLKYGINKDFTMFDENLFGEEFITNIVDQMIGDDKYENAFKLISDIIPPDKIINHFFYPLYGNISILTDINIDFIIKELESYLIKNRDINYQICLDCLKEIEDKFFENFGKKSREYFEETKKIIMNKTGEVLQKKFSINKDDGFKEVKKQLIDAYDLYLNYSDAYDEIGNEEILLCLIRDFNEKVKAEKRSQGILSFLDVAELSVDILKNNNNLRSYYKDKFKYIMIDEFQDNNKLQKDLLFLISERKDISNKNTIPSGSQIDGNKLFFVGDEKQSIYRFRGADVSVFKQLSNEIGNSLTLDINYRSESFLIDRFNEIFMFLFTGTKSYDAKYQYLIGVKNTGGIVPTLNVFLGKNNEDEKNVDDEEKGTNLRKTKYEADFIAKRIKKICESEDYLICKKGKASKPTYGDIAILLSKSSAQMDYEKALRAYNIPYIVEESRSLMLEAVSSDLYQSLQYLLYPNDKLAFIALARSPFMRVSDDSLRYLSSFSNIEELQADLNEEEFNKYLKFKESFEKAFEIVKTDSITSVLDYLFYDCGYYVYLLSNPEYHAYIESFSILWDIAKQFEDAGLSIFRFVDYLRENLATSEKLMPTTGWFSGGDNDAVRIMTIHKSKGLEFPIVFLPNFGSPFSTDRANEKPILKKEDLILSNLKDINFRKLYQYDEDEKVQAEMLRLLYVAFTRAETHLFVSGSYKITNAGEYHKSFEKSMLYSFLNAIGFNPAAPTAPLKNINVELFDLSGDVSFASVKNSGTAGDVEDWIKDQEDSFFAPAYKKYKASELGNNLNSTDGMTLPDLECDDIISKYEIEADFGSFVHLLLEKSINENEISDDVFENGVLTANERNIITASAKKLMTAFKENKYICSILERKPEKYAEVGFFMSHEDGILEGVADLLLVFDDFVLILDYKTDKMYCPDNHRAQLLAYIKAFSHLYEKKAYGSLVYLRDIKAEPIWDENGNEVDLF